MPATSHFSPPRQRGQVTHGALIGLLALVSLVAVLLAFQTEVGLAFTFWLLLGLFSALPVPFLVYRLYALNRAGYSLDRDTVQLVWGLRVQSIPVSDVEWVRGPEGFTPPVALPWFSLPGGILGITRHRDIGEVEFLASESDRLLLLATAQRVYAISPENPGAFVAAFQKVIEMGSLTPGQSLSLFPSFVVAQAWHSPLARYLWMAAGFLNIGIFVWVSLLIPSMQTISMGFLSSGAPGKAVPGPQLLLLPLLSVGLGVMGWAAGLFFYRREGQQQLAFALWVAGVLSALVFLAAVFFIVTTPV